MPKTTPEIHAPRDALGKSFPPPPDADASKLDCALWNAKIGNATGAFKIHPAHPGEKRPNGSDWVNRATNDPDKIRRQWKREPQANICLVIQPGFVAIDGDIYKPGNADALATFEAEHGKLPTTLTFRSARGGFHSIYKTTKTLGNGKGTLPDFGDVRGYGGQIIGPGSKFDGKPYTVWKLKHPVALPKKFEAMLSEKTTSHDTARSLDAYGIASKWDRDQATRLVDDTPELYEGGRNEGLYKIFAEAKGRGINPHAILEAVFDSDVHGGLDDDEITRTWESVYRDGNTQDRYGHKCDRYMNRLALATADGKTLPAFLEWKRQNRRLLNPRPLADAAEDTNDPAAKSFYYLDEIDSVPDVSYIVDGVLPDQGCTLVYGRRSTKKSFKVLDVGLSIAANIPFHGHSVKPGRVALFAGEGFRGNRRRVAAFLKARDLDAKTFAKNFVLIPFNPKWDTATGRAKAREVLKAIAADGPISLVIIDTVRTGMSGEENSPTAVGQFIDGVAEICREFQCARLLVHHAGKTDGRGARGAGNFEDDADAVFEVRESGQHTEMKCTKQKDGETNWSMIFKANKIILGTEPDTGKPITSLALELVRETEPSTDSPAPPRNADALDKVARHEAWARACIAVTLKEQKPISATVLARKAAEYLVAQEDNGGSPSASTIRTKFISPSKGAASHEPPAMIRHLNHPTDDRTRKFSHPDLIKVGGREEPVAAARRLELFDDDAG